MSLKPSKYLLEEFKKECREKYQKCSWGLRPFMVSAWWERESCIKKCVKETIEKERPVHN